MIAREGLSDIIDVFFVCDTQQHYLRSLDGLAIIIQCVRHQGHNVTRHSSVHFFSESYETGIKPALVRFPRKLMRVQRNTDNTLFIAQPSYDCCVPFSCIGRWICVTLTSYVERFSETNLLISANVGGGVEFGKRTAISVFHRITTSTSKLRS
jgi:hypothetical protein